MPKKTTPKYIFVVGGVISGVGKGIASSSIAKLLQDRGLTTTAIKIDPYINLDAGTMNPTEHGEVFVLKDGDETDQDMGNYERFLNIDLTRKNYMTTGRVYETVIHKERNLEYQGRCVEVVPHIPLEVIHRIERAQKEVSADVVLIEIGGTVGEYQNMLFLEAARMMKIKKPNDVFFVMVSFLPIPQKVGEMKTKPTQNAVRTLNASGIQPDIIIARSEVHLDLKRKEKLSTFCNIPRERIISAPDVDSIYDVPLNFEKEKLGELLCSIMGTSCTRVTTASAKKWKEFTRHVHNAHDEVRIAVIGKYFETGEFLLSDAYLSVIEAIKYSAYWQNKKPKIEWISANDFEKNYSSTAKLKKYDGIIVPGGFGSRAIEGKINVIRYARENKIPYLGLCYGMQLAVIEFARHVATMKGAHTTEVNPKTPYPVIDIMEGQKENVRNARYGGSMRLGEYNARLVKGTIAYQAYGKADIVERHRHRFEVNPLYVEAIEKKGMVFSGFNPDKGHKEIVELPKKAHPFFVGTQYHPEFLARPLSPHPLFTAFIKAAVVKQKKK
ncbi:MAG: CTP synthase [Candidatus Pacebacteria bacterium]|nr:CTP synthase [Candidatus Paceibacterota bacterium]